MLYGLVLRVLSQIGRGIEGMDDEGAGRDDFLYHTCPGRRRFLPSHKSEHKDRPSTIAISEKRVSSTYLLKQLACY